MMKKIQLAKGLCLFVLMHLLFVLCSNAFADDVSKLFDKAKLKTFVPVIVGLQLPTPFIPEGSNANAKAIEKQRAAIMEARENFFVQMSTRFAGDYTQYAQWDSVPYVAMKVNEKALGFLANNPHVTSIHEDTLRQPHLTSTSAHIGSDDTWDAGFGGMGWTVVILDTGIDSDHQFFGGRVVQEACWSNGPEQAGEVSLCPDGSKNQTGPGSADATTNQCWSTVGDTSTGNLCDHGSHVAGIAAGRDNSPYTAPTPPPPGCTATDCFDGVAPDANIIAIQVFTRINDCKADPGNQPCVGTYDSDYISALDYVNSTLRNHWNISSVNMSLGGGENTSACDGSPVKPPIDNLRSNGIATVISSGNNGWTDALGAPGCISTAITVGTVYDGAPSTDDPNVSCGTFDEVSHNMHPIVDLLAVGKCVDSSIPDDTWGIDWGGTSMAAPQVTGAFAMLKAIDSSMSVDDIEYLLETTGVLVRDERPPCDFSGKNPPGRTCETSGIITPRIQLDAAIAELLEADLWVFKDCKPDQPMLVGETAICTITVQNLGPDSALGVISFDEYVSNGTFMFGDVTTTAGICTATSNPQVNSGNVECDLGGILPGNSVTIKIEVTADAPQDINDRVFVSSTSPDLDFANNVAEDEVTVTEIADLEVFKDCKPDEPLLAGEMATCFITVKNWGPSVAQNVSLRDAHVSNGTFNFGASILPPTVLSCTKTPNPVVNNGEVNCDLGDLDSGEVVEIGITLSTNEKQNINDTALVSSDTYDPDNINNSASDGVGFEPLANLALSKVASPEPVTAGTQLTYDLEVTNNGPSVAINVVIEDVLPAGMTIDLVNSSAGTCNAGVPGDGALPTTCTFDSLAVSASETMQIVVTVEPQVLGILGNNARVYSDVFDNDNSDNRATIETTVEADADLMVTKFDSPDPVLAGEILTYDVTIQNNGPSTAVDVMVSDTLADEVSFQGYIVSNGSGTCQLLEGPPTVECDLNDLNPGEFVTVFIKVLVDPSVPDGTFIFNSVAVSAVTPDQNSGNNSATEETLVNAEADLSITKDSNYLTDIPSEQLVYTLLVSNSGPSDALNVMVTDVLPLSPPKIIYLMDSGNGACSYDDITHEVTCDFGTLPAGDSVTVDIAIKVNGSVRRITNVASVSTTTNDPISENDTFEKEVRVKGGTTDGSSKAAEGKGKTCKDGKDNDNDGLTDCADPNCSGSKYCP